MYQRSMPWFCWMRIVDAFEHRNTTCIWRNTFKDIPPDSRISQKRSSDFVKKRSGRQVMEAMIGEFPGIEVLTYHGPYISEPNYRIPEIILGQADSWDHYELAGPFFVGMMQGKGTEASVIDGGEVYQ